MLQNCPFFNGAVRGRMMKTLRNSGNSYTTLWMFIFPLKFSNDMFIIQYSIIQSFLLFTEAQLTCCIVLVSGVLHNDLTISYIIKWSAQILVNHLSSYKVIMILLTVLFKIYLFIYLFLLWWVFIAAQDSSCREWVTF